MPESIPQRLSTYPFQQVSSTQTCSLEHEPFAVVHSREKRVLGWGQA